MLHLHRSLGKTLVPLIDSGLFPVLLMGDFISDVFDAQRIAPATAKTNVLFLMAIGNGGTGLFCLMNEWMNLHFEPKMRPLINFCLLF